MKGRLNTTHKMRIHETPKLRVIIEGPAGIFDDYFLLFNLDIRNRRSDTPLYSDIGDTIMNPTLRKNKRIHKVEMGNWDMFTHYQGAVGKILHTSESAFVSFEKRINFVAGLAVTACVPMSQLRIYDRVIDNKQEFLNIYHDGLVTMLKDDGKIITDSPTITGRSFSDNFTMYFNYFWFNFDHNITKHDEFILKTTLEHA